MMKRAYIYLFLVLIITSCSSEKPVQTISPKAPKITKAELDARYAASWAEYKAQADTAANENYFTEREKQVFYYLNLARINPELFAKTYAKDYEGEQKYVPLPDFTDKKGSLIEHLEDMDEVGPLRPSHLMYEFAKCHAEGIGQRGLQSHDRSQTNCPKGYFAENIAFGKMNALEIVMQLLVDAGPTNLAHRRICLSEKYQMMGISIQPHKATEEAAVLNFSY